MYFYLNWKNAANGEKVEIQQEWNRSNLENDLQHKEKRHTTKKLGNKG
jgi:hypothetical protein